MKLFLSELTHLSEIYDRFEAELRQIEPAPANGDPDAWITAVTQNSDLFTRITQMDERVSRLSLEWVRYRDHLTPDALEEVRTLAARLREQAARLSAMCGHRIEILQSTLHRIERYLGQVRAGNRLLESLKTVRVREPRFIDSEG